MPSPADRVDVILIFGGDGTIHRNLAELVRLKQPVLIVPTGSGNDFARALGLRRVSDSVAAWRKFCAGGTDIRTTDLGEITPRNPGTNLCNSAPGTRIYFCTVAGVGLDAEVTRRANLLPGWLRGHGGYALTAVSTIFQHAAVHTKISAADEPSGWKVLSDQPTILAAFANTAIYGGGMRIAPRAVMDDGLLEVCVVGEMNSFRLACVFPTVYLGRHLSIREVDYFRAGNLLVETDRPLDVYADGEYVCRTPVEIGVTPAALKVLVPGSGAKL